MGDLEMSQSEYWTGQLGEAITMLYTIKDIQISQEAFDGSDLEKIKKTMKKLM